MFAIDLSGLPKHTVCHLPHSLIQLDQLVPMLASLRRAQCPTRRAVRCLATDTATQGQTFNIHKCVDKAHAGKPLSAIIELPPGALKGLKEGKADEMLAAFKIKTVKDLGAWKHYHAAKAISVLAATEQPDKRPEGAASNINGILDKGFEDKSFKELLAAPPSALQGLAPWTDGALSELGIKSVSDLAKWKYAAWAHALTVLAAYERAGGESR